MKLQEHLCCPTCKANLSTQDDAVGPEKGPPLGYACSACGRQYACVDGVVDFLPERRGGKGRGQKLMEWDPMVRIYEGKWWRANWLFAWFMGIRLADEMSLIHRITHPGPQDRVLDLACGPGLYARSFARGAPARKVFGLDVSWPMLRYAAAKARRLGMANVAFLHGDAHALPFRDGSIDVANCCGALHLFADVRRVLGELARVIVPGGRFSAAMALRTDRQWNRYKSWSDGRFWGVHHFRQEEIKALLDEAGFEPTVYHAKGIWMIAGGVRRA